VITRTGEQGEQSACLPNIMPNLSAHVPRSAITSLPIVSVSIYYPQGQSNPLRSKLKCIRRSHSFKVLEVRLV